MTKRSDQEALLVMIHETIYYLRHDLLGDLKHVLFRYVGPILVSWLTLQCAVSVLRELYKLVFPPGASELHRYVRKNQCNIIVTMI
jgi:hypothetical protein